MSKFRNKNTDEFVEANSFTELFAFSHNSNYELVTETKEEKPKANSKKKTETKEEKPTELTVE